MTAATQPTSAAKPAWLNRRCPGELARRDDPRGRRRGPGCQRHWAYLLLTMLLAGYLLFAHGCHAEEDTELLLSLTLWLQG